jgi:ADP-ribosylglycohydrolase
MTIRDRAAGAVIGALIGDALGLGPHWYYDLDELRKDYGSWINGYTDPKPGRYHSGMRGGQLSQSGIILAMLLRSVVELGDYVQGDFTRRLDDELFPKIDGTPFGGPGGYTNQSIREAYRKRVLEHRAWGETGGPADTTEAAERAIVFAARYAKDPGKIAETCTSNCILTQNDPAIMAMSVAYASVVGAVVRGEPLDERISDKLLDLVHQGMLPFHHVTSAELRPPDTDVFREQVVAGNFSSPDALLTPGSCAQAAADPTICIEPPWKVSIVYGMPCAIYHQLPAAYYLATKFCSDFESAVLHALNGGGQNMSRACLTGALVGAQVGLPNIPKRFVEGLENHEELIELAMSVSAKIS